MAKNLTFSGGKELERALLELTTKSAQKVGRFALRKAANPIAKKAKAIVRKKERRVEKAITVRVDRMRNNHSTFSALVYLSDKKSDYRPRNTNRKSKIKGKLVARRYDYQIGSLPSVYGRFLERGRHKQGIAAFPFFRPAWDSEGGATALNRLGDALGEGLAREAQRLGR